MTTAATLLTLIAHAQQHVAALESLAAGMAAGLRAGMIDADHLYTLVATQARTPGSGSLTCSCDLISTFATKPANFQVRE